MRPRDRAAPAPLHADGSPTGRWGGLPRPILLAGVLALAVLLAYQPSLPGGFLWDDDAYVTANHLLTAPDGLGRIWFSRDQPSQYFPLTYTLLRLQRAVWGLDAAGYRAVNLCLHFLNALLLARLLARLGLPSPWLAALLFAIHPVQVETVAWIAELKNVLSLLFSLLALLAWLSWLATPSLRRWLPVLGLLALAVSAKTTAVTLPLVMLLLAWFLRHPPDRSLGAALAPLFLLGLAAGLFTVWWELEVLQARGPEVVLPPLLRVLAAGRSLWFYLITLLWPAGLAFSYPRWEPDPLSPWSWLWPLTAILAGAALFRHREAGRRGPATALAVFAVTLAPLLGFIPLYTFRYASVADHYQYAAAIGPLALLAAAIGRPLGRRVVRPLPALLCLTLCLAARARSAAFVSPEALWTDTLRKNPLSWMAHAQMGNLLLERDSDRALAHYRESLRLSPGAGLLAEVQDPTLPEGLDFMRATYAAHRRQRQTGPPRGWGEAELSTLERTSGFPEGHYDLAVALFRRGRYREAEDHLRRTLLLVPGNLEATVNLGVTLARQGRREEAVGILEGALAGGDGQAGTFTGLGAALLSLGRPEAAARAFAAALARDPGNDAARRGLAEFRRGPPPP